MMDGSRANGLLVAAVVAATLGATIHPAGAVAQGDDGDQGDRAQLERAKEHMERGQELYVQSRFLEAAEEFKRAYEAQAFAAFLYNAAVAYQNAGEPEQALEFYGQYLDRAPDAQDADEVRGKMRGLRQEARGDGATTATAAGTDPTAAGAETGVDGAEVDPDAAPEPAPARGIPEDMKSLLSIRTDPAGAQVTLTQTNRVVASGAAPFAHTLTTGEYAVKVEHPDYRTVEERVRIRPGKVYVVIVEMSQGQFLGYLRVLSNVPGASVYVDDREVGAMGATPFANPLATGEHRLWIEKPGFETVERDVELGLGDDITVSVDLQRLPYGRLRAVSNVRGAKVYVDGEQLGVTPFEGNVDAGVHRVRVAADGMKDWEQDVDIERGQETPIRVRLRPAPSRAGAWVTAVLAAGFIGGGIAMGLLANDREDELEGVLDDGLLANDDGRIEEGRFLAIGANAAFGIGAILGILSIYYFVKDDLPDSEGVQLEPRDWALFPQLDPRGQGGGAVLRVTF